MKSTTGKEGMSLSEWEYMDNVGVCTNFRHHLQQKTVRTAHLPTVWRNLHRIASGRLILGNHQPFSQANYRHHSPGVTIRRPIRTRSVLILSLLTLCSVPRSHSRVVSMSDAVNGTVSGDNVSPNCSIIAISWFHRSSLALARSTLLFPLSSPVLSIRHSFTNASAGPKSSLASGSRVITSNRRLSFLPA